MKKVILLASALAFGSVAFAQDASQQPPAGGTAAPTDSATPSSMPQGGDPSMPQGSMPQGGAMPSTAPTTDPSQGGAMPGGMQGGDQSQGGMQGGQPGGMQGGGATGAGATDDSNLPTCSKTVTDHCKQGAGGGHATAHKRMARKHK